MDLQEMILRADQTVEVKRVYGQPYEKWTARTSPRLPGSAPGEPRRTLGRRSRVEAEPAGASGRMAHNRGSDYRARVGHNGL